MYKDKDKQREANRKAQAKFKAKGITQAIQEGITEGVKLQEKMGITEGISEKVLPDAELKAHCAKVFPKTARLPTHKRGKDIKTFADQPPDMQQVGTRVVIGKPGDADYNGICTKEWRAERGH